MTPTAVTMRIARGDIVPGPDGKLSLHDVDHLRRTQRVLSGGSDRNNNLLKVRVHAGAVKIKEIELRFKRLEARSVERDDVTAVVSGISDQIVTRIGSWAERYAEVVARDLDIEIEEAAAVLQTFSDLARVELGDIRAEAAETLRRL
jgi:hypothetical protein